MTTTRIRSSEDYEDVEFVLREMVLLAVLKGIVATGKFMVVTGKWTLSIKFSSSLSKGLAKVVKVLILAKLSNLSLNSNLIL